MACAGPQHARLTSLAAPTRLPFASHRRAGTATSCRRRPLLPPSPPPAMQQLRSRSPLGRRHASDGSETGSGGPRGSLDVERAALLPRSPTSPTSPPDIGHNPIAGVDHNEPIDWMMTTLLFLFPALGGLLFGYDIGASSAALLNMTSLEFSGTDWYALTSFQSGLVVSLSLAGALAGSAGALLWGDALGRRRELLLASTLYAGGALGVALAPSLTAVLAGRALYGVGIGFAMHAAPAYIAETSPPRVRGLLISLKEALIVGGILAGYAVGYLGVEAVGGWRWIYGAAAPLSGVLAAGMAWLPESPRWLLLSGGAGPAAVAALRRVKGSAADAAAVQAEVDEIEAAIMASPTATAAASASNPFAGLASLTEVLRPRYRRPLTVGVSLMLFQQITGQPSVLYYAAKIFQDAGFSSAGAATGISVVLGVFKLAMTGVAVATVDSWGRRPLLLTGVAGIVLSLVALAAASSGAAPVPPEVTAWVSVFALLAYVGAYSISFGPISWLIVGEVFPLRVRGQAIALATLTNFLSNFLVSLALPSLQEGYGQTAMYVGFAAIGVVALGTINAIVPETKGCSLEEIERLWGGSVESEVQMSEDGYGPHDD